MCNIICNTVVLDYSIYLIVFVSCLFQYNTMFYHGRNDTRRELGSVVSITLTFADKNTCSGITVVPFSASSIPGHSMLFLAIPVSSVQFSVSTVQLCMCI